MANTPHQFHIPVMGIAFTIDTPIKVARFGISSVLSIVEDRLIETMRKHYAPMAGMSYIPIGVHEPDYRARRITDYLNLVEQIVSQQVERLKSQAFEAGSEIVKYFELLPDQSEVKARFLSMLQTTDEKEKQARQDALREQIKPGSIDVNIMTKVDREHYDETGTPIPEGSDAVAALRGYANSNLTHSAIVFSAGLNPRLFNAMETYNDFDPDEHLSFKKKVIIKVSDFRSASIQGKYLAKKGIWVSEFRIESGLNCGGHAFATEGYLLGPILREFKDKRQSLSDSLFEIYKPAIEKKLGRVLPEAPSIAITVQGGIGTHQEHKMLLTEFDVEGTGWGTPFLLVPEATTVDAGTLDLLARAEQNDISLSRYSPLGVRFHYLHGTTAEKEKLQRIARNTPGSPCTEKHLALNTEFTTEPICTASTKYQQLKISQLATLGLAPDEFEQQKHAVLSKECLCIGLSNAAALAHNESFINKLNAVNICPGPNIVNFSRTASLKEMTDHIYGRTNLVTNPGRPHLFIAELTLYVQYIADQMKDTASSDVKALDSISQFLQTLLEGIAYYQQEGNKLASFYPAWENDLMLATRHIAVISNELELKRRAGLEIAVV